MFKTWKLRRHRRKLDKNFEKDLAKLRKNNAPQEEIERWDYDYFEAARDADIEIEIHLSDRLIGIARRLDARLPAYDDTNFWVMTDHLHRGHLNTTGRDLMAQRIAEVNNRNFENWAKWVRLFTPFIAALVGIIGAFTGLIAVWWRLKP